ncbi:MAG: putative bifunctional diguanylate cyclase/phosphodiesterase [Pseudomonadota bacterium]
MTSGVTFFFDVNKRSLSMVDALFRLSRLYTTHLSNGLRHLINISAIAAGLIITAEIVYVTGGTAYAYPYLILIPVALAAALYRVTGGLVAAFVAGLLLGPLMPLDATTGEMQSTTNWVIRLGLYVLIGGVIGGLFSGLNRINLHKLQALRLDTRTQLPNTAALDEDLKKAINRLQGKGSLSRSNQADLAAVQLTFLRITDLSDILETFGPDAADQALVRIIARIRQHLGDRLYAYRFSVSEIVLLDEQTDRQDPSEKIQAMEAVFNRLIEIHGIPVKLSPALGSHQITTADITPMTLIQQARLALSSAVERGVSHSLYDAHDQARMQDQVRVITGVRKGLENNEFELYFQPKFCLRTGKPCGSEGLIRWRSPNGDLVPPGRFMPKVETTSLIDPVTRFVVRSACEHLQKDPEDHVSINFSARNLMDDELIKWLPEALASYGIQPARLEIELTEGALIGQPDRAQNIFQELRQQGFQVSLDDFGTGYSSFEYLSRLPVTGLKIDKTFVRMLSEGGSNHKILRSMIDLGKALNLTVTLEGIEYAHEYELLREMGGDVGQGFYLEYPMPEAEYQQWKQRG